MAHDAGEIALQNSLAEVNKSHHEQMKICITTINTDAILRPVSGGAAPLTELMGCSYGVFDFDRFSERIQANKIT